MSFTQKVMSSLSFRDRFRHTLVEVMRLRYGLVGLKIYLLWFFNHY
jgi:hypothetical protein